MGVHLRTRALRVALLLSLCSCVAGPNDAAFCDARARAASGTEVIVDGTVARALGTVAGRSGPHEGFLMRLRGACRATVRVETNVAFTGPIPLHAGDRVVVKGEYDNDGGEDVIHFTHRELHGHHAGGYVELGGTYYW